MKRTKKIVPLTGESYKTLKLKMLNWANPFSISVFLDNNNYQNHRYHFYECLLAVNPIDTISFEQPEATLNKIATWHRQHQDWLFGHIQYDFKNRIFQKLSSAKTSHFNFQEAYFFCPETVCYISADKTSFIIETLDNNATAIYEEIMATPVSQATTLPNIHFQKRIDEATYLSTIQKLQAHIKDGDCYEINFCNEGYATAATLNPIAAFNKLNELSPAPFAAFYKHHNDYMLCSSPERYLCKTGDQVIAQPIKGTQRRGTNSTEDEQLKHTLFNSKKDRAENVMIVDLMRNDLAKSCQTGSIEVEELFGIYSYPKVHQMISTISGTWDEKFSFIDLIENSFPMGSMTGAPKLKVMELIERYEASRRELFSGTIGYIQPDSSFDFNVIIRSLFYNASTHYLSYQTGGAITYDSNPVQEWEETLLKAFNLEKIFQH